MPAPRDPVPILNGSGEDIPSHAVVEPTGVVVDGAMTVRKCTRTGFRGVWVNSEGAIPAGAGGQATRALGVTVLVDGDPALGAEWGARAGSWAIGDVGGGGFIVNSPATGGRVNAIRTGVTVAPVSGSGSGTDVDGDGTADRRVVYDIEQSRCETGLLAVYRKPVYQYLGTGLMSAGPTWRFDRYEGCCSCGPSGSGSGSGSGGSGDGGGSSGGTCCTLPDTLTVSVTSTCAVFNGASQTVTRTTGQNWNWSRAQAAGTYHQLGIGCVDGLYTVTGTGLCSDGITPMGFTITGYAADCAAFSVSGTAAISGGGGAPCCAGENVTATAAL